MTKALLSVPEAGIREIDGYDYSLDEEKRPFPNWMTLLPHRHATTEEIPKGYKSGWWFSSMVIETPRFMPWLMRRFTDLGGKHEERKLESINEAILHPFQPEIVVNCTGLGARGFLKDDQVYPIRGHVVRVNAPQVKKFYNALTESGETIYILPRSDCVVCGGTAQKGEWDTSIDSEESQRILERCERLFPGISKSEVISEWTGLRPGRSEIRLEMEPTNAPDSHCRQIIHNYGHGGGGMTLSWGCAQEVVELAEKSNTTVRSKL
eukprot:TRINITY_DN6640_c0_g1_i1.p1 TRINITY_DN6640_c0_g1~~TRINITY_DN6640_c0_g1_i1.p1  ORF type:complete len:265 (+),score=45.15 TRINITY_DN6640_c0_g1_i1:361-1155(+)